MKFSMESVEEKLIELIDNLIDTEVLELEIKFAKFNQELKKLYEEKIKLIEDNLNSQIKFYGIKIENYFLEKQKILNKYAQEFQKIYNQRRDQFFNIQLEIQEIQSNQKIAIANFKKVIDNRKKLLDSSEYIEYLNKKQEFQNVLDTTLKSAEFEKYTKLLDDLKNPLESHSKKLVALVQKYDGYKALIEECDKKLSECLVEAKKDFEEIVKYRNNALTIQKEKNIFVKFITSILNKIMKNAKFEKEVVNRMQNELIDIEKNNQIVIENISNQTISLIAIIEKVREELNQEFKLAIE